MNAHKTSQSPPDICPVCGSAVPLSARACPDCGADDNTGWNEDQAVYDGLDLPNNEFDYDEYRQREFGPADKTDGHHKKVWVWLSILGFVLVVLALGFMLR